jgi:hypothetical protein
MTEPTSRLRVVEPKHPGSGLAQWAMLLTPIIAAYSQQQLSYAMVTWACSRSLVVLVHLPTLLAIGACAIAAVAAWRTFVASGAREAGDERSADARARFMSACALTVSGFAGLLILAQWLPTLFVHPCQR